MIHKSAAELAGEMTEAQIESIKADTRRTNALALALQIEIENNERTRHINTNVAQQGVQGLQSLGRRC